MIETPPAVVAGDEFESLRTDATLTSEELKLLDEYYVRRESSGTFVLRGKRTVDPQLARLAVVLRTRGVVGPRLAYPQADAPAADVYARLILISILEGSTAWAVAGIEDLRRDYAAAVGRLGGREVNYVEALTALLLESRTWPNGDHSNDWPTFAGNAARNKISPINFDLGAVRWRLSWPTLTAGEYDFPARRPAEDRRALLSYWPIVVGDRVYWSNGQEIRAHDLKTGKAAWGDKPIIFQLPGDHSESRQTFSHRATVGVPRFTLTAHGDRLYARLGNPVTSAIVDGVFQEPKGVVVCLNLADEGALEWIAMPPDDDRWAFEGTPIADDDFVYVALRKGGVRPQAHVVCLDAETGEVVWRRMICSAETPAQGQMDEITGNLLTLVGDSIYYNTNLGAVAALSKHNGEIRWVVTYPRAKEDEAGDGIAHFFRDLTPCVYDRGTLFVAPSDSRHLLALDASAGLLQWESSYPKDVVHLLGVGRDYLLASGDRQWWIHSFSGRIARVWPDESPKGFGRGAIVGDVVLRPTRTTLEVFGVADGERRREIELTTRGAQGGHVIAVDDSILIATGSELIVFDRHAGVPSSEAVEAAPSAPLSTPKRPTNPRVDE
jgi:outer membrane protein assembly factor BamB